jgi:hypothetical protein
VIAQTMKTRRLVATRATIRSAIQCSKTRRDGDSRIMQVWLIVTLGRVLLQTTNALAELDATGIRVLAVPACFPQTFEHMLVVSQTHPSRTTASIKREARWGNTDRLSNSYPCFSNSAQLP